MLTTQTVFPRVAQVAATIAVFLYSGPVIAQTNGPSAAQSNTSRGWTQLYTPWGDPDLQGIWNNATSTPFERAIADDPNRLRCETGAGAGTTIERGKPLPGRVALVVDPPDGRIPPLTAEAKKRRDDLHAQGLDWNSRPAGSYKDLDLWTRCITRSLPNSIVPTAYNNNYQILQIPGYVIIHYELIHDVRVIPLDGRPHIPANVRQWMGDSRGHWEGKTLVVDVTNFDDRVMENLMPAGSFTGTGASMHFVERFTRVDADTVNYEFTVDDPTFYTRRWTASIPMRNVSDQQDEVMEYACHEGNYSIVNILTEARSKEKNRDPLSSNGKR